MIDVINAMALTERDFADALSAGREHERRIDVPRIHRPFRIAAEAEPVVPRQQGEIAASPGMKPARLLKPQDGHARPPEQAEEAGKIRRKSNCQTDQAPGLLVDTDDDPAH